MPDSPHFNVAVRPFETSSLAKGDETFTSAFVPGLLAELSRFSQFGIIPMDQHSVMPDKPLSDADLAIQFGASYILEGGFRRFGQSFCVTTRLKNATNGEHILEGRYSGSDLHSLHDSVALRVITALSAELENSRNAGRHHTGVDLIAAHQTALRGMERLQLGSVDAVSEACALFRRALSLDSSNVRARAGLALAYFSAWNCRAWDRWGESEQAAYTAALEAERIDADDPLVQCILARIELYRRRFDLAEPRVASLVRMAPSDPKILIQLVLCLTYLGDSEQATPLARRVLEMNPSGPASQFSHAALAHFASGDYEQALALGKKSPPTLCVDTAAFMAAASALLGRDVDASRHLDCYRDNFAHQIASGREPHPGELLVWILHVHPFANPATACLLEDGLRRAGLGNPGRRPAPIPAVNWPIANTFRREHNAWTIAFQHEVASAPELRGFHDIRHLLSHPRTDVDYRDLPGNHSNGSTLSAVKSRIRTAGKKLAELHPAIGRHFSSALRTGAACSYVPEGLVSWFL